MNSWEELTVHHVRSRLGTYHNRGEYRAECLRRGKSEVKGGFKGNENIGLRGRLKEDRTLKRRREREDGGFLEKFNS
jgi:hypothetical protein